MSIAIVQTMRVGHVVTGAVRDVASDQGQIPGTLVNFEVPCLDVEWVSTIDVFVYGVPNVRSV